MRNFLLALSEGAHAIKCIFFLIFLVIFLNLFFGCTTPGALAVKSWTRNNAAIAALKEELADAPKGSEKEARIRQAIDALEKSNVDISEQAGRAGEAEKKATSGKKWLYLMVSTAFVFGAVAAIKFF